MSKFETFTGYTGADQGCLTAWNLPDMQTGIALIHHDIGRNVLGRETCGVIFVKETEQGKLQLLDMLQQYLTNGYDGPLGSQDYLWTLVEKDGGLYKAKFLTADAIDQLTLDDVEAPEPEPAPVKKKRKPLLLIKKCDNAELWTMLGIIILIVWLLS